MAQSKPHNMAIASCPVCRAPSEVSSRPFCSKRCADIDLSRWFNGTYAIAGGDADEDGDDAQAAAHGGEVRPSNDEEK